MSDDLYTKIAREAFGDSELSARCLVCNRETRLNLAAITDALRNGWPMCCKQTMLVSRVEDSSKR